MPRVVIVSYGLHEQMRRTLDRARRVGHPIHLVPAIPSAERGLRRHRSGLVTVHEQRGRAGLDAALGPDDETVLVLHEDVLLSPDAAATLLEHAAISTSVVLPMTNHVDVDNPAGELPPDAVQPVGEAQDEIGVRRFRSVCMAADAASFRRLLRHRLTAATTRITVGDGAAVALPHVVATHLDEGRDQLEPPVGRDGRPLLVASMIVRNEEEFLPGCLASLEGIVDRVVVCDTGSDDRTVEVARAAGAHVIEREWRDDFAWARNEALAACRDAWWVLHIDADERVRVEDPEHFRSFLATALDDRDGFDVPLQDIAADGSRLGGQQLPRLFPADSTTFVGRVHEVPRYVDGTSLPWTVTELIEIEHLGYQEHVIADRDKHARNLALARADYEEDPTSIAMLQLARALKLDDETLDEQLDVLGELYDRVQAGTDGLNEVGHIPVYQLYSQALLMAGDEARAWEVIDTGHERYPHAPMLRALWAEMGTRLRRYGEVSSLATAAPDLGQRPERNPVAEASAKVQVALSRLAVDDVDGAGRAVVELLDEGVPSTLGRWPEIVSIVAVTRPDAAIDLLLPAAASDPSAQALGAVIDVLDPGDAAQFGHAVCRRAGQPSRAQLRRALRAAADADALDEFIELAAHDQVTAADEAGAAEFGGDRITSWYRQRTGEQLGLDLDAAVAALAQGTLDDEAGLVRYLASDVTGTALRTIARGVPAAVAAPLLAKAVAAGDLGPKSVNVALATITIADDGEAAETLLPHLADVTPEVLETLVAKADQRGAHRVGSVLSGALRERRTASTEPGTSPDDLTG